MSRTQERQARYDANLEGFKIVLALKIYKKKNGIYPDNLSFLAPAIIPELPLDPFTGKDFIYRRQGKGFIVYSTGENGIDDGGKIQREQKEQPTDIGWEQLK